MTSPAPAAQRAQQLAAQAAGPLREIEKAREKKDRADRAAAAADAVWRNALAAALDKGCQVNDVAAAGKVHRTRVWQIVRQRTPGAQ